MRYFLSVDLNKKEHPSYSFHNKEITKYLKVEKSYQPESYIKLTTLCYEREKPGLIEKNWDKPVYNNKNYFIFVAGSVIHRNVYIKDELVPNPEEVLKIILRYGDEHYQFIKGNYYIIYLDKTEMKVNLYSSPMFMYPAFYSFRNSHIIISNYLESFCNYIPFSIDEQGLAEFTLFDHSIHNRTVYNEIKDIPGGHLIVFEKCKVTEKLVYDVAKWYTPSPKKRKDSLIEINYALQSSIGNYIKSTNKFNISLTGGFDGRLNFSFIKPDDYSRLIARSYGMRGSSQIKIPKIISEKLGFRYESVYLDDDFEKNYAKLGFLSVMLTCGVTGFNRAMYTYAYNIMKEFSRSFILGQCDMIRPLYNNPAGVIFNEFSNSIFFGNYELFREKVLNFSDKSFIQKDIFTDACIKNIYDEIKDRYISNYLFLNPKLRFYFFILKESMMKFWHTEFHLVDIFVDDYVSFADLDYLELLFNSEYAGIYKGLLASNQFQRRRGQDLYVDLMSLNNNSLNDIYLDRGFKPGWQKFGIAGWLLSAAAKKKMLITKEKHNDTFNSTNWASLFYNYYRENIILKTEYFNMKNIISNIADNSTHSDENYRFDRLISLKIWLSKLGLI